MTAYSPQVRYLWKPTDWWGARSFATQKEAEDFLAWLYQTRGDEIAETRIATSHFQEHAHAWIDGHVIPRNQVKRYKINHTLSPK